MAKHFKEIWSNTFPELPAYLQWVSKECIDTNYTQEQYLDEDGNEKTRTFFMYDTPLGLHRAKCGFCPAANGSSLQAPAAEGATLALYEVIKTFTLAKEPDLLYGCIALEFIHDEILWECPNDDRVSERVQEVERIMVESMRVITPDVKAGCETAAMLRWDKKAESIWEDGQIQIWQPKEGYFNE